jgi:hypothetical protein
MPIVLAKNINTVTTAGLSIALELLLANIGTIPFENYFSHDNKFPVC